MTSSKGPSARRLSAWIGAGEELLPSARRALDQDRDVVRGDPPGARLRPLHRRAATDDAVERGRRGRQAGRQPLDLLIGAAQQRRHVLGGDVERHGDRADAGLRVRLDELRGIAGLGEQHPHRLHGGGAGADVDRQVGTGAERLAGEVERPDRGRVDGTVVGRIGQGFGPKVNGRSARPGQPIDERPILLGGIVGQEDQRVEWPSRHDTPDGTEPPPSAACTVEIGLADPGEEHDGHSDSINYLALHTTKWIPGQGTDGVPARAGPPTPRPPSARRGRRPGSPDPGSAGRARSPRPCSCPG